MDFSGWELKADVDCLLWFDLNLLLADMRSVVYRPPGLLSYDLVALVPSHQGVLACRNPANHKLPVRIRDRKIRMIKSSPIRVHVGMDITLQPHHALIVLSRGLQELVVNVLTDNGHGDIQE